MLRFVTKDPGEALVAEVRVEETSGDLCLIINGVIVLRIAAENGRLYRRRCPALTGSGLRLDEDERIKVDL